MLRKACGIPGCLPGSSELVGSYLLGVTKRLPIDTLLTVLFLVLSVEKSCLCYCISCSFNSVL